jgi:putative addiction module killer protein
MYRVIQTPEFEKWSNHLRDLKARSRIGDRLLRLKHGNFGDSKSVGDMVMELRFHFGAGYRVYWMRKGDAIILLLWGGDKDSQARDIATAKTIAEDWKDAT